MKNKNDDTSQSIAVKDLSLSSFLMATDKVQLIHTQRNKDGTVFFHFAPINIVEQLISDYWADSVLLPARKLFGAQRDLKDLIFSGGREMEQKHE